MSDLDRPTSLEAFARDHLARLDETSLRRHLNPTTRGPQAAATRHGRSLVSFSCNDYLGLSQDPRVIAAAQAATALYGTGAGASRLVTGSHPPLAALEERLAAHKGTEAALVFGSGYLANLGHRLRARRPTRPDPRGRTRPFLPLGGCAALRRESDAVRP